MNYNKRSCISKLVKFPVLLDYFANPKGAIPGGGALGYFLGGYVPPGLQIGTPF